METIGAIYHFKFWKMRFYQPVESCKQKVMKLMGTLIIPDFINIHFLLYKQLKKS